MKHPQHCPFPNGLDVRLALRLPLEEGSTLWRTVRSIVEFTPWPPEEQQFLRQAIRQMLDIGDRRPAPARPAPTAVRFRCQGSGIKVVIDVPGATQGSRTCPTSVPVLRRPDNQKVRLTVEDLRSCRRMTLSVPCPLHQKTRKAAGQKVKQAAFAG